MTTEQRATQSTTPARGDGNELPNPPVPGAPAAQMVIGGERVSALEGKTFDVVNPATGQVIGSAPLGDRADVDRAVDAARKAFEGPWSTWSAAKRGRTLQKYSGL